MRRRSERRTHEKEKKVRNPLRLQDAEQTCKAASFSAALSCMRRYCSPLRRKNMLKLHEKAKAADAAVVYALRKKAYGGVRILRRLYAQET